MSTPAPTRTRRQVLEVLSGLLLAMFVSMLATTVVSTSLPVIVHDLGGSQSSYTWVVTAALLTNAISTPIWGKLADLFDRKLMFQIALIVFITATAAAGLAQDTTVLIACRAIQGVGIGGLAALSQIIMADIISPRERGRYMGLFGGVMAVATVGGPLLGGVITDAFGWRWNFYVAIPFAILAFILLQLTLHLDHAPRKVRIDYVGVVLLATSVSLLLIWVTNAGTDYDWWSVQTAWMVGGALVAAIAFVWVELRVAEPLFPLQMFRNRTFTLAVLASIATGIVMFGASVFLSQYMQMARGATPTEAGIMTIPMIGGLLVSSILVGQLITRFGIWKPYVFVGSVMLAIGLFLFTTVRYDTDFVFVAIYMALMGAGVGMVMQNLVLVVQNTARPSEIGVASSGVTFFRSLGGTIGVAVMGGALSAQVTSLFTSSGATLQRAIAKLGEKGADVAAALSSGTLPEVSTLPESVRVIVEDIYAQAIAGSFLIAVPAAIVGIIAVAFLPNVPLTQLTASERRTASAADLATSIEATGVATGVHAIVDPTDAQASDEPQKPSRAERAPDHSKG